MGNALFSWRMVAPGEPLCRVEEPLPPAGPREVLLEVKACGVCHTDWGFLYGGVRTNAPLPLTLGHEIVGQVVAVGEGVDDCRGEWFIVPAVLPCGDCELCARGRGTACRRQQMPGNDLHGGFASHFLSPFAPLCPIPRSLREREDSVSLAVIADAVSTAYQSVVRADVGGDDIVVVVGAGGVGSFLAQVAKARGSHVAAIDVDAARLDRLSAFVDLPLDAQEIDSKQLRREITRFEKEHGHPPHGRKVFECSGTAAGQQTAFSLLTYDGVLAVVGFTLEKVPLRLSNLMAFDARAFGNWGCLPELFPEILKLVEEDKIVLTPFVETIPMSRLNDVLRQETHSRRPVLIPDFEGSPC